MIFPPTLSLDLPGRAGTAWARFRALERQRRWLLLEAAVLLVAVRAALLIAPFGTVRRHLKVFSGAPGGRDDVRSVGWAVQAVARRLSSRPSCLLQALVADLMLRRRGCRSAVQFGVRRAHPHHLDGHAWVECEGTVVVGGLDELGDYERLTSHRSGG